MNNKEFYMRIALEEAKIALDEDNLPIGAVLVIGGKIVDKGRNQNRTSKNWSEHAENSLIIKNSSLIRESIKKEGLETTLYSTMEPCLMCLGTATLHRVSNMVYSCPDPIGGATSLKLDSIGAIYQDIFPKIEHGPFTKESYNLFIEFLSRHPRCSETFKKYKSLEGEIINNGK